MAGDGSSTRVPAATWDMWVDPRLDAATSLGPGCCGIVGHLEIEPLDGKYLSQSSYLSITLQINKKKKRTIKPESLSAHFPRWFLPD